MNQPRFGEVDFVCGCTRWKLAFIRVQPWTK